MKETARLARENDSSDGSSHKKRKVDCEGQQQEAELLDVSSRVRTRSQSRMDAQDQSVTPEVIEDSQDEDFVPGTAFSILRTRADESNLGLEDGLVACPICNRRMKLEAMNSHLDSCGNPVSPPKPVPFG